MFSFFYKIFNIRIYKNTLKEIQKVLKEKNIDFDLKKCLYYVI